MKPLGPVLRVALAQLNPTIGDFAGNLALIRDSFAQARRAGADIVVYSELVISGYPPKDLVERESFVQANRAALDALAPALVGAVAIVGFIDRVGPGTRGAIGRPLRNAAAVIADGRIVSVHHKALLPTYDVFDEGRWFEPASRLTVAEVGGLKLGVSICEDIWNDPDFWPHRLYAEDPIAELAAQGAELLVNVSASPFDLGKRRLRPRMLAAQAKKHRLPLLFVNQVGGQDELLFDGHSLAINAAGEVRARAKEFAEELVIVDVDLVDGTIQSLGGPPAPLGSDDAAALDALVLGTRDYARRCGFKTAVIGLSGGIDSALVACIAARALGPENVWGVSLPSRYSSPGSLDDARALAERLGIHYEVIGIEGPFKALVDVLAPAFAGKAADTTEENLQARVRGTLLMALSNKHGHLVLSTGNKSELAVGYCTLYGDMVGGLAVIADVPKTMVYRLAAEINRHGEIIPQATIDKPPSAELRPDQTDQDTLPPYEVLDQLVSAIVERGLDAQGLAAEGHDPEVIRDVMRLLKAAEYKRRQAAPGLKLTSKAFGAGRRIPVAHLWRGQA